MQAKMMYQNRLFLLILLKRQANLELNIYIID